MMMSGGGGEEELQLALDIVIEILKRLPIKSLIKFTSVSKQWKSIIKSSTFISDHNRYVQQLPPSSYDPFFVGCHRLRFAVVKKKQPNKTSGDCIGFQRHLSLPTSDDFRDFKRSCTLIGYSQGLFGFFNNKKDRLLIWNPAIRKSVFIPLPPDHHAPTCDANAFCFTVVCNATEPTIFNISDNYTPQFRLRLQIYTSTAGAWRTVSNTLPREPLHIEEQCREVTDRFIYWIVRTTRLSDYSSNHMILSFDITSEQFTELCLPPTLAICEPETYLHLSKHRESLVVLKHDKKKQELGVWMTEPDAGVQNPFAKKFTVKRPDTSITPNFPQYPAVWNPVLGFTKYGQLILLMLYLRWEQRLLFYEPDLESVTYIAKPGERMYTHLAGSYMETLLLLDH